MTATPAEPIPCVTIATGWREPAIRAARAAGLEPRIVVTKERCAGRLGDVRRQARRQGIRTLAIHSGDWARQPMPQLFELAAARLGLPDRRIVDDDGGQRRLGGGALAERILTFPAQAAAGVGAAALEGVRLARRRHRPRAPASAAPADRAVLVVWRGLAPDTPAGGAVTHISGILSGFREHGLRVVLLTAAPPPPPVAAVVDELDVVPPLPPRLRVTTEVADISTNPLERGHGLRLIERVRPAFVYARADPFVTSGVDIALRTGVPVVLEWNSSAVWTRANWQERRWIKEVWNPVLRAAEGYVTARSDVVAAVSEHAGEMAVRAGADPARVVVVPNGVDLAAIDRARAGAQPPGGDGAVIGWVGSFGPWHGAEVLVEALAELPADVRAVMVGDGARRTDAMALASRLGVEDRIEWTGSLPHDAAVARLAACDVLASPHVPLPGQPFFGSPTKLFEYMAIGRPIVASALEQIGDVLDDGRTARLVTPGDPADLAAGIRDVLADPEWARKLGAAAREEAEAHHGWDQRAGLILERLAREPALAPLGT